MSSTAAAFIHCCCTRIMQWITWILILLCLVSSLCAVYPDGEDQELPDITCSEDGARYSAVHYGGIDGGCFLSCAGAIASVSVLIHSYLFRYACTCGS